MMAEQPELILELQLLCRNHEINDFIIALCQEMLRYGLPLLVAPKSELKDEKKLRCTRVWKDCTGIL